MVHHNEMMENKETQMKLRLTADLKNLIDSAAKANKRSLNSEILTRLQASFEEKKHVSTTAELLVDDAIEAASDEFKKIAWKLLLQLKPNGPEAKIVYDPPIETNEESYKRVQAYLKNKKKPD